MKKHVLLLLMMGVIAFTGCKEDNKLDSENPVVGKWFVKKTVYATYEAGTKKDEEIRTDYDSSNFLELKADGTGTLSDNGDTDVLTYTRKDNILSLSDEPGETLDFTIKQLTSTELTLVIAEEFTEGNSGVVHKHVQETYFSK